MIRSFSRGHEIYFKNGNWYYADTYELYKDERPCKRCGKFPTKEGYDACLGYIEGVAHACCGHGIEDKEYYIGNKEQQKANFSSETGEKLNETCPRCWVKGGIPYNCGFDTCPGYKLLILEKQGGKLNGKK